MANISRKLVLITASALALSACANRGLLFSSTDAQQNANNKLPSLSPETARFMNTGEGAPPSLGNTYFEPQGVTQGVYTQTFVGQKISQFHAELTSMQSAIRTQNSQLQSLREKTRQDSRGYHENVAFIRGKLQLGTTPANPILMNRWEVAQAQLNTLNQDLIHMNQLVQVIAVNQASTRNLLGTVRSAYTIPGAVDEDHVQLRIVEDETQQTSVLIDRLLAELRSDITRQTTYVNSERSSLSALASALQRGQLFGLVGSDGYATSGQAPGGRMASGRAPTMSRPGVIGGAPQGGMMNSASRLQTTQSYAGGARTGTMAAQSARPQIMAASTGGTPVVVIRFDRPNVSYEAPMTRAIREQLQRNSNSSFTIVTASAGSSGAAARAGNRALQIITGLGVSPSRVNVMSMPSTAGMDEVRIIAR